MKLKFIKSPTGEYGLAYFPGDEADIKDSKLADKLVKGGFAEKKTTKK